jgi:hypothetical protein
MESYPNERRKEQRAHLPTFCPTKVTIGDEQIDALMIDVSESGARFRVFDPSRQIDIELNSELHYDVKTPYGMTEIKGRTAWKQQIDDFDTWGIEFTDLSQDTDGKMRSFITSLF